MASSPHEEALSPTSQLLLADEDMHLATFGHLSLSLASKSPVRRILSPLAEATGPHPAGLSLTVQKVDALPQSKSLPTIRGTAGRTYQLKRYNAYSSDSTSAFQFMDCAGGMTDERTGTKRRNCCSCKKTHCLKLYCECFAAKAFCEGCNCTDCHNAFEHMGKREEAVRTVQERNNDAFAPKIASELSVTSDAKI